MHRHHRHRERAPEPRLQLSHPFARVALGGTIAVAVLSAGAFVFGPFSDLSILQLAAGPPASGPDVTPAATLLARIDRSPAPTARPGPSAASTPVARLARRDTRGP